MLSVGIVGLPNVGKSTLFNALTRTLKAASENYPFCTIEPNVGMVEVADERLFALSTLSNSARIVPSSIEFVDIAGLVKGAWQGEGLGNRFLSHIRDVDLVVHLVRCFEQDDIIHEMGNIDPIRDMELIGEELILADLQSVEGQIERQKRKAKTKDKEAMICLKLLEQIETTLTQGKNVRAVSFDSEHEKRLQSFGLLSAKKVIYACNVNEQDFAQKGNAYTRSVQDWAKEKEGDATRDKENFNTCLLSAAIERELSELEPKDAQMYLESLGVKDSGVHTLVQKAYRLLSLKSFFTTGEKETRAWTFKAGMKAPQCAGIIHTDFQKHFIKAEVVSCQDFLEAGSVPQARQKGTYRLEGKDYPMRDGDVVIFKTGV